MEWQNTMAFGTVLKWFFKNFNKIILLIPFICMGQTKEKGLSFEANYLFLVPYNEEILNPKSEYDLTKDTRLSGVGLSINYYFLSWLSVNIGSGFEKINKPEFDYIPVLLGLKMAEGRNLESFVTSVNFGKHIGKFDNPGFIFRWSLGYRFKIYKSILGSTEMYYSYQNIYKTFDIKKRTDNIYNIESVGLKIGIEIN